MQTPAEKCLVQYLSRFLKKEEQNISVPPKILNIGAGRSLAIENQLIDVGCNYICDRIDVEDCSVVHPAVDKCWRGSVEMMTPVESNNYSAAFANYVLEHVLNLGQAAREIYRILKPSGIFVTSISNPTAPEFIVAKRTPLWFHKIIRKDESWETHYAYKDVKELIDIFESAGLRLVKIKQYSFAEGYLTKFFVLNILGKIYDKIIRALNIKRFMGNVCLVFKKE